MRICTLSAIASHVAILVEFLGPVRRCSGACYRLGRDVLQDPTLGGALNNSQHREGTWRPGCRAALGGPRALLCQNLPKAMTGFYTYG
ncbi:hypothetical protein C8Q72DRAFT_16866 [Fomitopsis betulina]|nr:hypothetical protein C8Q72DRAFT_16866 [Fomitopsis betulina]